MIKETSITDIASLIDHTLLAPEATVEAVAKLCEEAHEWRPATVCVYPHRVSQAAASLHGTGVGVCTVIGFPFGLSLSADKVKEAVFAADNGANEFDMVINLGAFIDQDFNLVEKDIRLVREALPEPYILKVILETAALTDIQIVDACKISEMAGADYVKTSSGFHPSGGATCEAVALMAATVPNLGIKASGGINTREKAESLLAAGATRIGSKSTGQIIR